ncbi:TatD family hydrolase [Lactobacillus acetotolerans]|jgi:TatD DNase family protein|uniref:Deoxyribonuclease n=1 Tax=Lactobacillus acetotolerans TaxID=1600 RepID=A0A0D6A1K4_9LACO|nr:TatD family hydrolase [Lactobacillus acetotolerans]KRN38797.1 hydrolase, TatD family protein [Lactobacillus acetotolerans DSM 20749 = JCM 3825]QFG50774.1 TatD family deoxyribonuclease [Lactobacillus acetotolerans]QGV05114.1 YchF/TatD family DNA exonuclease [Lactobacillus acetotolerans]QJD72633.1 TatD family hydrolase [Lactobacillus acetotolerans]BAQ56636.1 deoxyribonuclease [Lactobacillus acetotolerans]
MKIIDNHTHLNDAPFRGKEEYYLERAQKLGVTKIICAGQDPEFNERAIDLAQRFDNVYAMVGFCPDVAKDYNQKTEDLLTEQLQSSNVVALGEIGLDYYWDKSPRDVQRKVFAEQIELAHKLHLPVDIHTRDAFADCYDILKHSNLEYGAILHSFNGNVDWLNKFLDLNVYISYSGVVSFTKATDVHESAINTPMDRILVETDAPYLTPKPYRGHQNEPGYARYVAEAIAKLKNISLEEVANATYANTVRAYGLK